MANTQFTVLKKIPVLYRIAFNSDGRIKLDIFIYQIYVIAKAFF